MNNADHTTDTSNTDGIAYAQYCATTVEAHPTIVHNQSRICRTLRKYMLEMARLVCDQKSPRKVKRADGGRIYNTLCITVAPPCADGNADRGGAEDTTPHASEPVSRIYDNAEFVEMCPP